MAPLEHYLGGEWRLERCSASLATRLEYRCKAHQWAYIADLDLESASALSVVIDVATEMVNLGHTPAANQELKAVRECFCPGCGNQWVPLITSEDREFCERQAMLWMERAAKT